MGAWHQDGLADCLSAVMWLWLWLGQQFDWQMTDSSCRQRFRPQGQDSNQQEPQTKLNTETLTDRLTVTRKVTLTLAYISGLSTSVHFSSVFEEWSERFRLEWECNCWNVVSWKLLSLRHGDSSWTQRRGSVVKTQMTEIAYQWTAVVTSYKCPTNPVTGPNLVCIHLNILQHVF
jgi:hypothetical protein